VALSRRSMTNVILLILVNTMWAAQYPAYKVASEKMGPVTLSAWTFLFADIALLPFFIMERCRADKKSHSYSPESPPFPEHRSLLKPKNLIGFFMIGIIGLMPASAFLAWGVNRSSASDAALIYLTVPILTALLASLILKEKMTWVRWGSLFLALMGVVMMSNVNWHELSLTHSEVLKGNLLVLTACASSSFYNVYCKELLNRFTPLEVLVVGYFLAVVVSLPLIIETEGFSFANLRSYQRSTWVALIVLSALSWGLAMVLWMFLLKRLDVSQASVSIYLLPFLGVLISAATLHEKITVPMIVGGLVTLTGTILITTLEPSSAECQHIERKESD
jgi:drug/metabolite transporter (DMT)-like permease